MKVLIVEDDNVAYFAISLVLSENGIEDIFRSDGFEDAVGQLKRNHYDLVLLDVHLGDGLGTDLVDNIPLSSKIIFTTSDPNYAVKAFEIDAVDYLIKPISLERFNLALEKLDKRQQREGELITIKADLQYYKIPVSHIQFIETSGGYLTLHTKSKDYTFHGKIKEFLHKLPDRNFIQCHRSFVVNKDFMGSYKDSTLYLTSEQEIPVSKQYRKEINSYFRP